MSLSTKQPGSTRNSRKEPDGGGSSIEHDLIENRPIVEDRLRQMRRAVARIDFGVTLTDGRGRIVFTNPAEAQMHGYAVGELVGQEARRLAPEASWRPLASKQLPTLNVWRRESVNRRKDGTTFPVELVSDVLLDAAGQPTGLVTCSVDISDRENVEEQILYRAYYDALTGLPNNSLFHDRFAQALAQARRCGGGLAVAIVDIDRFKTIRDDFGRAAADRILRDLGERISGCLRGGDTVARIRGDRFTLLLPLLRNRDDASTVVGKILRRLSEPLPSKGGPVSVTTNAGLAVFPHDGRDAETLLQRAERAMDRARIEGLKTCRYFDPMRDGEAGDISTLEVDLRQALARKEMVLYYEGRHDLRTGITRGSEARLRWNHPARGQILHGGFVAAIERAGLAGQIGGWALRAAAVQARIWRIGNPGSARITIGVLARQLRQPGFERSVERVLAETGCGAELIEIELPESGLTRDVDAAVRLLGRLAGLGVSLAVGEFAASPWSFTFLRRLPIQTLKVNRASVRQIAENPGDRAMVRAIIETAHSFGASAVAEGVDTEPQRSLLADFGCDAAQGDLFGKPEPADAFQPSPILQT